MRVGFVQTKPVFGDVEWNLHRAEMLIESASADVLLFPELFATGYLFKDDTAVRHFAEPAGDGKIYSALHKWAQKLNALIVAGFPEIDDDYVYNSAIAVQPDGNFYIYRKLHLFDREKMIFRPGNLPLSPFSFRGVKFGILICFDWIFPEAYRTLALRGAQIILHPANLVLPYCQKATYARAIENRIFIVLANRTGKETYNDLSLRFTGQSVIYSPMGDILAQANGEEETVEIVKINPNDALNKWITQRNHIFNDRRPQYYFD